VRDRDTDPRKKVGAMHHTFMCKGNVVEKMQGGQCTVCGQWRSNHPFTMKKGGEIHVPMRGFSAERKNGRVVVSYNREDS